jgi:uncharacterized membrane protein
MKEILNRVPALKKITTSLSEPVDVDLTTLVNRKSTYQDLKESKSGLFTEITINYFEAFAFGFMMLSWGFFMCLGYVNGLKNGNKFVLAIEEASGIMLVVAGMFLFGFMAALAAKVKKWK